MRGFGTFRILLIVVVLHFLLAPVYPNPSDKGGSTVVAPRLSSLKGWITNLVIGQGGRVWVATWGGAIGVLAPDGNWTTYS